MSLKLTNDVELNLPSLTEQQKPAVFSLSGPILAEAVPGSGKTRTITCRLAYLSAVCDPRSVLAITFTKAAAAEMSGRVRNLLGGISAAELGLEVTHFHSFTYRLLKHFWGVKKIPVAQPEVIISMLKRFHAEITGKAASRTDEFRAEIENFALLISRTKSLGFNLETKNLDAIRHQLEIWTEKTELTLELWKKLEAWYGEKSLLDFDDLLNKAVFALQTTPEWRSRLHEKYRHIMVDEFQDTNPPQWALIRGIVENTAIDIQTAGTEKSSTNVEWNDRSLLVCGDADQAIYGFRSADVRNILSFPEIYRNSKVVELTKNYRSSALISNAANRLIVNNRQRRQSKLLQPEKQGGPKIALVPCSSEDDQVNRAIKLVSELFDGKSKVAVLARNRETRDQIRNGFQKAGIPVNSSDGVPFEEDRLIRLIAKWLTTGVNLHDSVQLLAAVSESTNEDKWLRRAAEARNHQLSLFEYLWQIEELNDDDADFLLFLKEINKSFRANRFSDAVRLCIDRSGVLSDLCSGRDPLRTGRLVEILQALEKTIEIERTGKGTATDIIEIFKITEGSSDDAGNKAVSVLTIHAAKGLEFDSCLIVDVNEGVMPQFDAEDAEEERRIFYVAMTRAAERLVFCFNKNNPSRYLKEISSGAEKDFVWLKEY